MYKPTETQTPYCVKCRNPCEPEKFITLKDGSVYHASCFTCEVCAQELPLKYALKNGRYYHIECYSALKDSCPKCLKCTGAVLPSDVRTEYLGMVWHKRCTLCDICHLDIHDEMFLFSVRGIFHSKCVLCTTCNLPILNQNFEINPQKGDFTCKYCAVRSRVPLVPGNGQALGQSSPRSLPSGSPHSQTPPYHNMSPQTTFAVKNGPSNAQSVQSLQQALQRSVGSTPPTGMSPQTTYVNRPNYSSAQAPLFNPGQSFNLQQASYGNQAYPAYQSAPVPPQRPIMQVIPNPNIQQHYFSQQQQQVPQPPPPRQFFQQAVVPAQSQQQPFHPLPLNQYQQTPEISYQNMNQQRIGFGAGNYNENAQNAISHLDAIQREMELMERGLEELNIDQSVKSLRDLAMDKSSKEQDIDVGSSYSSVDESGSDEDDPPTPVMPRKRTAAEELALRKKAGNVNSATPKLESYDELARDAPTPIKAGSLQDEFGSYSSVQGASKSRLDASYNSDRDGMGSDKDSNIEVQLEDAYGALRDKMKKLQK